MSNIITEKKWTDLRNKMTELGILEKDITEKYIRSSGAGGQHANKNDTCVYLRHTPSGLEAKCAKTRFRENNRFFARRILVEKMDEQINKKKSEKQQKIEKLKRQKRKRSKRAKDKMLDKKKQNANKKANRKKIQF